jgi:CBS domain-containing protein
MSLHFKAIQHELPLRDIITLVNENQYALLPVFRGKHLIGVIDRNDIENYLVA